MPRGTSAGSRCLQQGVAGVEVTKRDVELELAAEAARCQRAGAARLLQRAPTLRSSELRVRVERGACAAGREREHCHKHRCLPYAA
eukprot:CAMPEP_0195621186 /NCGR_PEP_ID=MMETSP0815-20121206/15555_1 /TAXON_ID=97485 /ORGANISM="Prymnesium parvum, Strain Texoma1" /LENGTH=85 /DNA_ID=CAMNT_0040761919 /DNA_START=931 /DNA_END=1185 /DNA_ORIENTATION=+